MLKIKIQSKLEITIACCIKDANERHLDREFLSPHRSYEEIIKSIEQYRENVYYVDTYRQECTNIINSIYACYCSNPSPFSLDLIQAVGRQQNFNGKAVNEIDWQGPFGIARGIRQYYKFLHLMFAYPGQVMVPTLEIDLAWHTHMLHPLSYRTYTLRFLKRMINHDDNIAPDKLKEYSKGTEKLWNIKHGDPASMDVNGGNTIKKEGFFSRVRKPFNHTFKADFNPGTLPDISFFRGSNGYVPAIPLTTSLQSRLIIY